MCSCQNGENNAKEHVNNRTRDTIVHNTEMADISASRENKNTTTLMTGRVIVKLFLQEIPLNSPNNGIFLFVRQDFNVSGSCYVCHAPMILIEISNLFLITKA